jgi:hypothetical protein
MKIKVEKWIIDDNTSYKILSIEQCCDKIIKSENISINNELDDFNPYYKDNTKDINYSVKLIKNEYGYDGRNDTYYETINYCPWCGEKIEIEIINTIDKTEEYKSLQQERNLLWGKCCRTDSKKKEYELQSKVTELDKKINSMLISDDFTKESV